MSSYYFHAVIRIGYELALYTFEEPDFETYISQVRLIREDNRQSEQTFSMAISITDPTTGNIHAATLDSATDPNQTYDFRGTQPGQRFFTLRFFPQAPFVSINFFFNADSLPEGLEGFSLSVIPSEERTAQNVEFPNFRSPLRSAFQTTEIRLIDHDCKLTTHTYTHNSNPSKSVM